MENKKTKQMAFVASIALAVSCASPQMPTPPDNPDSSEPLKPASEYFDFKTSQSVNLQVSYGSWGAEALIDLYDVNPEAMNDEGDPTLVAEPIYRVFADKNGRINERITLPGHVNHLYLYANRIGLPNILEADVVNGVINVDATQSSTSQSRTRSTRADKDLKIWPVDEANQVYSINPWEGSRYGKVTDVNGIISEGNITGEQLRRVQTALWNNKSYRGSGNDNRKWAKDVDERALATTLATKNLTTGEEYKDAEVWVTLATEYAYSQISLGYYYYPTPKNGEKLNYKDFDKLKKFIIFPNTSTPNATPYKKAAEMYDGSILDYGVANAPVKTNTRCQLLYVDENGNISKHFPAGYTIGYFIVSKLVSNNKKNMLPDATYKIPSVTSQDRRCAESYMNEDGKFSSITLKADESTTFFCFENKVPGSGTDSYTFDDVIFTVTASPRGIDKQIPPKDLPEAIVDAKVEATGYHTYAYEDQWPNPGDYDLNDVMVEHTQKFHINNSNKVTKMEDIFTSCQPKGAATYYNAFAYHADYMDKGVVNFSEGVVREQMTDSYVLFANANNAVGKSFTITTTFTGDLYTMDQLKQMTTDPYIIVNYVADQEDRVEVHMPKKSVTAMANRALVGTKSDAYFIDKNGNNPFAIDVPLPTIHEAKGIKQFVPVKEGGNIGIDYPDYVKWVNSKGTTNTNWYENHK